MKPLIGVTTSELRSSGDGTLRRHGEPPHAEMALGMTYLRAIEAAGGLPVVLPPLGDAAAFLARLDGICLSGGPDLDPGAYGAVERHEELGPTEPGLDAFELELARAADARGLPVLGICRGAQALNVSRGGTLHQHLPDALGTERYRVGGGVFATNTVQIDEGTALAEIVGERELGVHSYHHQGVDRLGDGLIATAHTDDGLVQAIESTGDGYLVGVQWHPEQDLEDRRLFAGLVRAASEYAASRPGPGALPARRSMRAEAMS
jgi:putative glutamine amidotransferase